MQRKSVKNKMQLYVAVTRYGIPSILTATPTIFFSLLLPKKELHMLPVLPVKKFLKNILKISKTIFPLLPQFPSENLQVQSLLKKSQAENVKIQLTPHFFMTEISGISLHMVTDL